MYYFPYRSRALCHTSYSMTYFHFCVLFRSNPGPGMQFCLFFVRRFITTVPHGLFLINAKSCEDYPYSDILSSLNESAWVNCASMHVWSTKLNKESCSLSISCRSLNLDVSHPAINMQTSLLLEGHRFVWKNMLEILEAEILTIIKTNHP